MTYLPALYLTDNIGLEYRFVNSVMNVDHIQSVSKLLHNTAHKAQQMATLALILVADLLKALTKQYLINNTTIKVI